MDLTAFGPYALNVRTNISSYGPRARLIRAYYDLVKIGVSSIDGSNIHIYIENGKTIDDSTKGGLTQFWELFTVIPCRQNT